MKEKKTIYNLGLHQSMDVPPELSVTRVASGWIYRFWDYDKNDYFPDAVFVPFDNRFEDDKA